MYAIVRLNSFDPIKLDASPALEKFDQIHRSQPGYVGTMVVDLQAGRRLVSICGKARSTARQRCPSSGPRSGLLEPLMSHPSELIGAGTVISTDLAPSSLSVGSRGLSAGPTAVGC